MSKRSRITIQRGPGRCPTCGNPTTAGETTTCPACQTEEHLACQEERNSCGACGVVLTPGTAEGNLEHGASEHSNMGPAGVTLFHGHRIPVGEEPCWLDHPENVTSLCRVAYAGCALLLLFEVLAALEVGYHKHSHHAWAGWPGFFPIFGFLAYSAVVVLGLLLRKAVMRGEDYYDE